VRRADERRLPRRGHTSRARSSHMSHSATRSKTCVRARTDDARRVSSRQARRLVYVSASEHARRTFAAIDFETADSGPDSACALGVVVVRAGEIVRRKAFAIRPPRREFEFTHVHGITWEMVEHAPVFAEVWPLVGYEIRGASFLAAHNADFDRGVLEACCDRAGVSRPVLPFVCTVALARSTWGIFPTKLPNVCTRLGIGLHHHDALSDAEACARIVMAASSSGQNDSGQPHDDGRSSARGR